ncbi:hypothetical protein PAPYR_4782 [Paratrimastix pyriformis]|uniref:Uncharacterized protein n=1 Tax=Paratrimastix pyriformis TaxID=342808 RepID=A0ABQ8UKC0_9EUKA|nr:hypothetical protein PAPYR_4782 [Paratrimastix pyriformis]
MTAAGVCVPLLAGTFLGLLGYKLQWGGPGFSFAYVFIPLWLFALGIEVALVVVSSPCYDCSAMAIFVGWSLCLPGSISVTLVLITLRLDMGSVHTAFIVIPTLFWWLPLLVATVAGARQWFSQLRSAIQVSRTPPSQLLTDSDLSQIECDLQAFYGSGAHLAHDDPWMMKLSSLPTTEYCRLINELAA